MPTPAPAPAAAPAAPRSPRPAPYAAGVVSALLLWVSFPPVDLGWPAWFALAPLFSLIRSGRARRSLYLGAWLGGLTFWLLALRWVRLTDESAWLAWLAMALALSLWWPAVLGLARFSTSRLRLPLMIAAPLAWVTGEFVQAYVLTGFPWYYLAHSQYRYGRMIQVADLTGTFGISVLVAMANALWVELATRPLLRRTPAGPRMLGDQAARLVGFVALLAATVTYGAFRIGTADFRPGPRVALIQSDFTQTYPPKLESDAMLAALEAQVLRAAAGEGRPDLIVWPETSYPFGFVKIDPKLGPSDFEAQARAISARTGAEWWTVRRDYTDRYFREWVEKLKVPMLVGATTYDFAPGGQARYNSAVLVAQGGTRARSYHKAHLVPFGEYVPFVRQLPWMIALTPFDPASIPSLAIGPGPEWFDVGPHRFATAICFEDTIARVYRRAFAEAPEGRQPDLILNLTNDGWFQGSEELDVHLAVSVFRAVENRCPLARAVNTGISALIDGNGAIVARLPKRVADILSVTVPLDDRTSLYSRWGDWPGLACLAVTIGLMPLAWLRSRRARPVA